MILLYELLKILDLEENIKIYDNGYNHCLYEGRCKWRYMELMHISGCWFVFG